MARLKQVCVRRAAYLVGAGRGGGEITALEVGDTE